MRLRNWRFLAWAGVGLMCLGWSGVMPVLAATLPPPPPNLAASTPATPFPTFELPHVQGTTMRSADLRGKVVVVRFWATW